MPVVRIVTDIDAPVARCFDLARNIDLHLESMVASGERAVGGVTTGLIGAGQEVTWEARHLGLNWRMTSRITEFEPPHRFVDEMVRGPFKSFRHEHRFEPHGAGTRMTDVVAFRMALGPVAELPARLYLRRLLRTRCAALGTVAVTWAMDTPEVDEFTRHHLIVTELVARLPTVRDDAEVFAFECAELRKHIAKLEEFGPPG